MGQEFDIIVIGGGHAGAEAAHAAAKLGAKIALITLDPTKIGAMSCNPAIGGLAKGQMVREIDALGGMMGLATDATGIQFRMLNRSKGPAVWGPRAQADKYRYAAEVQRLLGNCPNVTIVPGEAARIIADPDDSPISAFRETQYTREANQLQPDPTNHDATGTASRGNPPPRRWIVRGVELADGSRLNGRAVIVTTGTFLRALMHTGERTTEGGRVGEASARSLSASLAELGLELGRLKTGTPPRLLRQSIDFTRFERQPGDQSPAAFSYLNEYAPIGSPAFAPWTPPMTQVDCWIGWTDDRIHKLIRDNLHRAPLFSGQIQGTGPRYCPSIEDKVVRFADKDRHHVFLEPESLDTDEVYCNGISTSLPIDVQEAMVRLIPGLQHARFLRHGYAVEYDMVWPSQIDSMLQCKTVRGLYLAGQINGTSGYEEAAAQGLAAGVNAVVRLGGGARGRDRVAATGSSDAGDDVESSGDNGRGSDGFVLGRDQAYIGVLIDDLVTKPPTEPYRMFTSRAEHRLYLRTDNADERLTAIGRRIGLIDDDRWARFEQVRQGADALEAVLEQIRVDGTSLSQLLRRPENSWASLVTDHPQLRGVDPAVGRRVEIRCRYAGYVGRQDRHVRQLADMERKRIPDGLDYAVVLGLRNEARSKLTTFTPRSLGQAMRISGITPADVTVLAVHLRRLALREGP